MLGPLDGEAIDRFVAAAGPESGSPLVSAEIRHVGGALSRPQPHHGALSTFDADYLTFAVGMVLNEEMYRRTAPSSTGWRRRSARTTTIART
jgi:hypothetical protein